MSASIQIDQARPSGTSTGTASQARNDLWQNRQVNLISLSASTYDWAMLSQPKGSTASLAGATTQTASFTPDLPGTYRIRLRVNGGGGTNQQIKVARVRFDTNGGQLYGGLVLPAPGELDGESNYPGNSRGWDDPHNDQFTRIVTAPKRVATIAALRLDLNAEGTSRHIMVESYATQGDAGGGTFYWTTDTSTADNGGTVIVPTFGALPRTGCWKRAYAGAVHAAWFGAVGDSTTGFDGTDDSAAIAAAILVGAGGEIKLEANKSYRKANSLGWTFPANTTFDLNGSIISSPTNANVNNGIFDIGNVSGCTIKNGFLRGSKDLVGTYTSFTEGYAIKCRGQNVRLQDLDIANCWWDGILLYGTADNVVGERINSHNHKRNCLSITAGTNWTFRKCNFSFAGEKRTVTVDSTTDTFTSTAHAFVNDQQVYLTNVGGDLPTFVESAHGVTTTLASVPTFIKNATANTFQLSATQGGAVIDITGNGTGTHYLGGQDPRAGVDVETENSGGSDTVDGGTFEDCQFSNCAQGLIVQPGSASTRPANISIRRCRFFDCDLTGMNVTSSDGVFVDDFTASGINGYIIQGGDKYGGAITNSTNVVVDGVKVDDCSRGFYLGWITSLAVGKIVVKGRFDAMRALKQTATRSSNTIIATDHGYKHGMGLLYTATSPIGGLTVNTVYYVLYIDKNTFSLSTVPKDWSTRVTLTSAGSGNVVYPSGTDSDGVTFAHATAQASYFPKGSEIDVDGSAGIGILVSISSEAQLLNCNARNCGQSGVKVVGGFGVELHGRDSGNSRELSGVNPGLYVAAGSHRARIRWASRYHDRYMKGTAAAATGGPSESITLDASTTPSNLQDDFLVGVPVEIVSGTGTGSRTTITSYDPVTRIAHTNAWSGTTPTAGSGYELRYQNVVPSAVQVDAGSDDVDLDVTNIGGAPIVYNGARAIIRRAPASNLVASPSFMSTADWTQTGLTSRTSDTLKENSSTSEHKVVQTVSGFVSGRPMRIVLEVFSSNRFAHIRLDSTHYANVNANTGALGTVLGMTASAEVLADGWTRLTLLVAAPTSSSLGIQMASSDNTISYAGDGSSTLQVRDVDATQGAFTSSVINRAEEASGTLLGQIKRWNGSAWVLVGIVAGTLTDGNVTKTVSDGNLLVIPPATLSNNRTLRLGASGAGQDESITIERYDSTANTYAVVDDVSSVTLYTFPTGQTRSAVFTFDGTNFVLVNHVAINAQVS